jgi:hypothetical protein
MKKLYLVTLILVLLLSACGRATPAPTQEISMPVEQPQTPPTPAVQVTETEAAAEEVPYPYPFPTPIVPYVYEAPYALPPTPVPPGLDIVYVEPSHGADTGAVKGILIDEDTGEPLSFQAVYLGTKVLMAVGDGFTITVQERTSPQTMSDAEGRFGIGDVPPGPYFVLIWTPFDASIIIDPETGREMEITIEAGQTLDLGELKGINPLTH